MPAVTAGRMIVATVTVGSPASPAVRYSTWVAVIGVELPFSATATVLDRRTLPAAIPASDPEYE